MPMRSSAAVNRRLSVGATFRGPAVGPTLGPAPVVPVPVVPWTAPVVPPVVPPGAGAPVVPGAVAPDVGATAVGATVGRSWLSRVGAGAEEQAARAPASTTATTRCDRGML